MRYRIEYADGRCCSFANGREDLMNCLQHIKDGEITDIRRIYKSGATDSVIDRYRGYIGKGRRMYKDDLTR